MKWISSTKVVSRSAFGNWTLPVFHMICGLFSLNHGNPKITSEDPKFVIQSFSNSFLLSILAWIHMKWVICPAWFRVQSFVNVAGSNGVREFLKDDIVFVMDNIPSLYSRSVLSV